MFNRRQKDDYDTARSLNLIYECTIETQDGVIRNLTLENDRLIKQLKDYEEKFRTMANLKQKIPEDCTPGIYCRACEFAKAISIPRPHYTPLGHKDYITVYICNKAETCKNFVERNQK